LTWPFDQIITRAMRFSNPTRGTATLIGLSAVLMWGLLAVLSSLVPEVPSFQLTAMALLIGGCLGAASWLFRPGAASSLRQPWPVWLLGIYGIFGYHFAYFTALRLAPPVEANLVNYLWPLLIVLFSALLPGEKLKPRHVAGAAMGFAGAALIVAGNGLDLRFEHVAGYAMALLCAVIWSSYSVGSRRYKAVPTDMVVGFCLAGAVLAGLCHLAFETTQWPSYATGWLAIAALGLLPTGLAFYVWDIGVKNGDIQVLGAAAYATPVISTVLLIVAGKGSFTIIVALALALVTIGAWVASREERKSTG
jgi:drug/metabolite transporter (DMT)-like permease